MGKVRAKKAVTKPKAARGRGPRQDVVHRLRALARRCVAYAGTTEHERFDRLASLLATVAKGFAWAGDEVLWLFLVSAFARRKAEAVAFARLRRRP